jgi:hypothetical protein
MTLTTLFLLLKLVTIAVEPERPLEHDDQALATCAVQALTARPSALQIAASAEAADATLIIGNHAGMRIHVIGRLVRADGTTLVEVNHVTHGLNHSLCHQTEGLLDEMARTLAKTAPRSR